jgi:hypothetical protein
VVRTPQFEKPCTRLPKTTMEQSKKGLSNNFVEQSVSWESYVLLAGQEMHCFLWNSKVRFHFYKRPALALALRHKNVMHTLISVSIRSISLSSFYLMLGPANNLLPLYFLIKFRFIFSFPTWELHSLSILSLYIVPKFSKLNIYDVGMCYHIIFF